MCEACGCTVEATPDAVVGALLRQNDAEARHNRSHFDEAGVLALNLMSSPGSGKTALLEATIESLRQRYRMAVLVGDLETDNDARRIRAHGVPAVQICTGSACHLDARMVHDALSDLELEGLDLLFIENVGNLVCPAAFDLGQHRSIALLSVTEGDDKPAKYPVMFRAADLVLITKYDLAPYTDDFDPARTERHVRALANAAPVHTLSAKRCIRLNTWFDWLGGELRSLREPALQRAVH